MVLNQISFYYINNTGFVDVSIHIYDIDLHIVLESCVTLSFSMHKMDFYIAMLHIKKYFSLGAWVLHEIYNHCECHLNFS